MKKIKIKLLQNCCYLCWSLKSLLHFLHPQKMVRLLWILLALLQLPHYRLLHHQSEFIPPHSVLTPQILKTSVKIGNYFALKKSANLNPFANLNHRSQLNLLSFLIARNETSLKGSSNDLSSIGFIQLSPSLIN